MLNASPINKITDRQQVLNDLIASKQRNRNDLKLKGKNTQQGMRLTGRRIIDITGEKKSPSTNTNNDSSNGTPEQQAQNAAQSPGTPTPDLTSELNAPPKTEFAPLQPEQGGPSAIESASEEGQGDKKTEGEQKTATEKQPTQQNEQGTEPPPANEQTAQQLQQEKAQAAQTQKQTTGQQTQNNNQPDDENSQIETLQAEIAKLQAQRKKVIDKANEELRLKIRGEWFKLFATGVTVVMIFYYLAKIKIIKMIYSREPREAKNIQKEIEAKNKEIKKIKRTSLRNRLFSRSSSASA